MGILYQQRDRLLRTNWTPDELALEMHSMFSVEEVQFDGPVKILPNPDVPGNTTPTLTLVLPTGATVPGAITIIQNGGTVGTVAPSGGGGDTVFQVFPPAESDDVALQPFPVIGFVTGGGPGSSYSVDVYPYGVGGTSYPVTVTQQEIAGDETIPVGTAVIVVVYPVRVGAIVTASYVMQTPVFLSDV